jgi:hypothetical protein
VSQLLCQWDICSTIDSEFNLKCCRWRCLGEPADTTRQQLSMQLTQSYLTPAGSTKLVLEMKC